MGFLKWLIGLPLAVIILVFAFVNNDLATFKLWPFPLEVTVSLSVAVLFFILFGFVLGKIFSWISYAPLRQSLRNQRKQNRKLSKERQKLVQEMEDLHKTTVPLVMPKPSLREKLKNMFTRKSDSAVKMPAAESLPAKEEVVKIN